MLLDKRYFPFSTIRPQQQEIIDELNLPENDKKYIIINAGTGVGKSPLAVAMIRTATKGYLCSVTHALEKQYVKDFSNLSFGNCHGRGSYPCNRNGGVISCDCGPCLLDKKVMAICKSEGICDYLTARDKAESSQIYCTNYDYIFRSERKTRPIMVLDEAHNLEDKLTSFAEVIVNPHNILKNCFDPGEISEKDIANIENMPNANWSKEDTMKWLVSFGEDFIIPKAENVKNELAELSKDPKDLTATIKLQKINKRQSHLMHLSEKFTRLKETPLSNWIFEYDEDKVRAVPLDISYIFNSYVDKLADRFVFMSATIFSKESFCRNIGIDPDKTAYIRLESPFDSAKSPIIFLGGHKLDYNSLKLKSTMESLAESVEMICNKHPNEKGIIHTGNAKITEYLFNYFNKKSDRFLFRRGNVINDDILYLHQKSKKPTVLVSSSLTEGISLDDDLSRFQIIVKWPWVSLADNRVKAKCDKDNEWYFEQSLQSVIQAAGRSTRSAEDSSVTYVLDSSFMFNIKRAKDNNLLGKQFLRRIYSSKGQTFPS